MPSQIDLEREKAALLVVDTVIDTLRSYGLVKDNAANLIGRAIADAAQHIEHKVRVD